MVFFWCKFGFGKCFWASLSPATELVVTSCHVKSTSHCMSQSDWEFAIVVYSKRRQHFKTTILFDFKLAPEVPTYWALSPFQFASNVRWPQNGRQRVLLPTSCVVARGSTLMIALNWSLATSDGQPRCCSLLSSPLQNFWNTTTLLVR